jgi:hypothetical protein
VRRLDAPLPPQAAQETSRKQRAFCTTLMNKEIFGDADAPKGRRVADPYKVNSHKRLHKPRADDIRPHTVQHTLAAVFSAGNEVRPCGVPLITHPQSPFSAPDTQKILPKEPLGQDLPFC